MAAYTREQATIAIVEDDAAVRESLTMLVRTMGYRVRSFASAVEFLARDDLEQPACLILDIRLAGMSGVELHEKLVRDGTDPPTIFLTGHGPSNISAKARGRGVVAVFEKPCSPDLLIEAIARAVGESGDHLA